MAVYWWLILHILLAVMPITMAYYSLAILLSPVLILSLLWGGYKAHCHQPEFTLLAPDEILFHQQKPEYYKITKKSFFCTWFCCLYLKGENDKRSLVVFRDTLSIADYKSLTRVIYLLS